MRWGRRLGGYIGPLAEFLIGTFWYIAILIATYAYRRWR